MAHDQPDPDLTPDERAAFEALPRGRMPRRALEERVVKALRAQGVLRRAPHVSWVWGAAAAAAIAIFASGMALGQYVAQRNANTALVAMHTEDARQMAAMVQRTGSAYAAAVARFAAIRDSGATPQQIQTGREVAVSALQAAAGEVLRLAPDDQLAAAILAGLERARRTTPGADVKQRVAWF